MKKIFILLSLIFSLASTVKAETPDSFIEVYNENLKDLKKDASDWDSSSNLGVKTEVNLPNYGLSFGADIKSEHLEHFIPDREYLKYSILKPSKAWIKYELPKLYDTSVYIKAFFDKEDVFVSGGELIGDGFVNKISVEADASHKIKDKLNIGLNSTTEYYLGGYIARIVSSKHKVYVKGEYSIIKDIDAELGLSHSLNLGILENVFLNVTASYKELKDIKLTGKVKLRHAFGNVDNLEYVTPDHRIVRDLFGRFGSYIDSSINTPMAIPDIRSFNLIGTYTGLKDTEIIINPFIEHAFYDDGTVSSHLLTYGINAESKYTGINNLVLSSKNSFIGANYFNTDNSGAKSESKLGFIKLNANAEYTYNLNDKLTFKPSLDLTNAAFINKEDSGETVIPDVLNISPKIIVEYNPIKNLTISGSLSPILVFDNSENNTFKYRYPVIKTGVNIKYAW